MSRYGRINLIGVIAGPAAALAAGGYLFGADGKALLALLAMNALPMLIAGAISGRLLRGAQNARAKQLAVLPTLVPAVVSIVWYSWRAVVPAAPDPGIEFLDVPQVQLLCALGLGIVVWVAARMMRSTA